MRFDLVSPEAGAKAIARLRATSVRRRVMCDPPHREGSRDGIETTSYSNIFQCDIPTLHDEV
jgi:hypothetical protein